MNRLCRLLVDHEFSKGQYCIDKRYSETNNTLARRFTIHRQQINNPAYRILGVSEHIDNCSTEPIKFTVTPFYKLSSNKTVGTVKEKLFIKQFQPSLNKLHISRQN